METALKAELRFEMRPTDGSIGSPGTLVLEHEGSLLNYVKGEELIVVENLAEKGGRGTVYGPYIVQDVQNTAITRGDKIEINRSYLFMLRIDS